MHDFVLKGVPEDLSERLESLKWPSVFSSENFEEWVRWNFVKDLKDREIKYNVTKEANISERKLIKVISGVMGMSWHEITNASGRKARLMRGIAIKCFRDHLRCNLEKLSSIFGGIHPANISKSVKRQPDSYKHIMERLEAEIQNAKRKT